MIGQRSARAGDTDALQKFSPAGIVTRLASLFVVGHAFLLMNRKRQLRFFVWDPHVKLKAIDPASDFRIQLSHRFHGLTMISLVAFLIRVYLRKSVACSLFAITGLRSVPSFSISTSKTSPAFSNTGGLRK